MKKKKRLYMNVTFMYVVDKIDGSYVSIFGVQKVPPVEDTKTINKIKIFMSLFDFPEPTEIIENDNDTRLIYNGRYYYEEVINYPNLFKAFAELIHCKGTFFVYDQELL